MISESEEPIVKTQQIVFTSNVTVTQEIKPLNNYTVNQILELLASGDACTTIHETDKYIVLFIGDHEEKIAEIISTFTENEEYSDFRKFD